MANEPTPNPRPPSPGGWKVYLPAALGWILPGGGHFAQGKWGRGLLLFSSVMGMFLCGMAMRGKLYSYNPADIVDTLAWLADIGAGGLFFAARFMGYEVPEPATALADYGTKFLLTAGLLNALIMIDAYDIAAKFKD